jgi:hypothetical protein
VGKSIPKLCNLNLRVFLNCPIAELWPKLVTLEAGLLWKFAAEAGFLTSQSVAAAQNATPGMPDFSWSKHTKMWKNLINVHKLYQTAITYHNLYQMAVNYSKFFIKYRNIFHSKALQNFPKLGFLVRKPTIWQPCATLEKWAVAGSASKTIFEISTFQLLQLAENQVSPIKLSIYNLSFWSSYIHTYKNLPHKGGS